MIEKSSLDIDVTFANGTADEEPLEVADRATSLPSFDVARFATDAMLDGDRDAELDRPTVAISRKQLMKLVFNSIPQSSKPTPRLA